MVALYSGIILIVMDSDFFNKTDSMSFIKKKIIIIYLGRTINIHFFTEFPHQPWTRNSLPLSKKSCYMSYLLILSFFLLKKKIFSSPVPFVKYHCPVILNEFFFLIMALLSVNLYSVGYPKQSGLDFSILDLCMLHQLNWLINVLYFSFFSLIDHIYI